MKYILMLCFIIMSAPSYAFLGFGVDCNSADDCLKKGDRIFDMSGGRSCGKALDYYVEACDEYGSSKGCHDAAVCYQFEQGNKSKAMKYFKKSCNNGNSQGCIYMQMR
jgi:TPR repeat protein